MTGFVTEFFWWCKLVADVTWVILCLIPALFVELFHLFVPRRCKDISGQVALVTGSAQGLGREMALELARRGCNVICVDVLARENEATAELVRKLGQKSSAHVCDISDREAVEVLASKVGNVDILINNAGLIYFDPLLQTPPKVVKKLIDVNVTGQMWMIRAFLPKMLTEGKGHVVTIASCAGMESLRDAILYSTSKFAVVGLMKGLVDEYRLRSGHMRFTCVCPYFVKTIRDIETRIEARVAPIEAKAAARAIIKGIRQELEIFTVPSYFYSMFLFQSLFPSGIQKKMREVFYTRVLPRDVSENIPQNGNPVLNAAPSS